MHQQLPRYFHGNVETLSTIFCRFRRRRARIPARKEDRSRIEENAIPRVSGTRTVSSETFSVVSLANVDQSVRFNTTRNSFQNRSSFLPGVHATFAITIAIPRCSNISEIVSSGTLGLSPFYFRNSPICETLPRKTRLRLERTKLTLDSGKCFHGRRKYFSRISSFRESCYSFAFADVSFAVASVFGHPAYL